MKLVKQLQRGSEMQSIPDTGTAIAKALSGYATKKAFAANPMDNSAGTASGSDDRVQGGLGRNYVLEGGDGLIKTGFMNSVGAQYHGADFVDGGAGDYTLRGGGGSDELTDAIHLIVYSARHSDAAGRFNCERKALKARKRCFRLGFDRSNIKTAHARAMRHVGHKGLGGRVDAAWGSWGAQASSQKRELLP